MPPSDACAASDLTGMPARGEQIVDALHDGSLITKRECDEVSNFGVGWD